MEEELIELKGIRIPIMNGERNVGVYPNTVKGGYIVILDRSIEDGNVEAFKKQYEECLDIKDGRANTTLVLSKECIEAIITAYGLLQSQEDK